MSLMFGAIDPEYDCGHSGCELRTWDAHKEADHPFDPIRPCKACGTPTTGSWCSTQCFKDEDGWEPDDDYEYEEEDDNDE